MRVCGRAGVRVCGCAGVRMCGCAGVRVCGCAGVRVCGCAGVWGVRVRFASTMNVCGACLRAGWVGGGGGQDGLSKALDMLLDKESAVLIGEAVCFRCYCHAWCI